MKFDYDYYKKTIFEFPIILVIVFSVALVVTTYSFVSKRNVVVNKILSISTYIMLCAFILFGLIDSIGKLKYGIYLNKETPDNALVVIGEIDKIEVLKTPITHGYKIAPYGKVNAQIITISGKEYYFMYTENLKIGDNVEITYLPKSTIVLEVNVIADE